jgi:hypothetical protein
MYILYIPADEGAHLRAREDEGETESKEERVD